MVLKGAADMTFNNSFVTLVVPWVLTDTQYGVS